MTVKVDFSDPDGYGQAHPVETEELLEQSLKDLDIELDKISHKDGWLQAKEKCPRLVDDKFKLQFLRCEVFNVKAAAKKIAKYWDQRILIFGTEKAFLPLTQKDAMCDDQVALEMGFFRGTGTTDDSGRRITFADPSRLDRSKYERESMARTVWYAVHAVLEDEATQRMGVVFVIYPYYAKLSQFDRKLVHLIMTSVQGCLPVRVSSVLIVHPPSTFSIVWSLIRLFMRDRVRKRVVVLRGSEQKVLKELSKRGFSPDVLPSAIGGNVTWDQKEWLEARRKKEELYSE